jgi:hypothetical protein
MGPRDVAADTGYGRPMRLSALPLFALLTFGCERTPPLTLWVDGFAPEHVSFEVKDLGPLDEVGIAATRRERAADGVMRLPPGSCPERCRVAEVTVFVTNRTGNAEAPPVVRLAAPPGRPRRLPIAYGGARIDPGRTGRVRWLVELWPDEERLDATISSSVGFDVTTTATSATSAAAAPAASPTVPSTSPEALHLHPPP